MQTASSLNGFLLHIIPIINYMVIDRSSFGDDNFINALQDVSELEGVHIVVTGGAEV